MTIKDITRKMPDAQPAEPTEWGEYTDQGPREDNQDRVLSVTHDNPRIARKGVLLIVCDGVGGEEGGQIASQTASLTAYDAYYSDQTGDEVEPALRAAINQANLAVKARAAANPRQKTMATTIVMTVVAADKLRVAHVGDSRGYLFRRGAIQQVTNDHNWVSERMRDGSMTAEQARTSTFKTTLTRSLGGSTRNEPDISPDIQLLAGDRVMLCSDGVHGVVSETEMIRILSRVADPNRAAQELVALAKANKTGDNVSALVLNYGAPIVAAGAGGATGAGKRKVMPLLISAAALLVALGVLAWVFMGGSLSGRSGATATPTVQTAGVTSGAAKPSTAVASRVITATQAVTTTAAVSGTATSPAVAVEAPTSSEKPTDPAATSTRAPTATPTNTPKPPTRTPVPTATPIPTATSIPATAVPKLEPPPNNNNGGGGDSPAPPPPPPPPPPPCVPEPGKKCS